MLKREKYLLVLDGNWLRGGLGDGDWRQGVLDGDLQCCGLVGDWWRGGLVSVDVRDMESTVVNIRESTVVSITEYRSSYYGSADSH